jgi:hypothetical protein
VAGNRSATRIDAARMLKRRLKDAGLSDALSPHSFRATGITNFLENGGTLEVTGDVLALAIYDRDDGRAQEFIELLSSLRSKPIGNLRVLLVLRSDYAPFLQPLNDARVLPFRHSGTNEMSVNAFRERDAREFLEKSPLKIQPGLMGELHCS